MSTSTDAKKRHVCVHCDQVCSTSSHLARHARIHSGVKEFKCDYPGCEKRSSRLDNLRAHQRIHSGEPRPKKSTKSKGSCAHASPVSSSSSFSSPDISYRPSPPELFHTPAAYSANETMSNSLQLFMPPPPPPQGGFTEDQFCNLSLQPSLAHSRGEHPYPRLSRSMPPPIVRDESANGFNPHHVCAAPRQQRALLPSPVLALRCADAVFPIPFLVLRCANGAFPIPIRYIPSGYSFSSVFLAPGTMV
ncbi:hypothetical protein B0H14DRAFT_3477659 [Mycena olivaceomarginata]|nr:hypothetical protein B0H14DRAFT_3477659 [Mycena olivaceomarginata]